MSQAINNPSTSGREENRRPWHALLWVVVLPILAHGDEQATDR